MKTQRLVTSIAILVFGWYGCAEAETIDPFEVDLEAIESQADLEAVEASFADVTEVKALLNNSRSCFHQYVNEELRCLHGRVRMTRAEFLQIEADIRFATRKAVLDIAQEFLCRQQLTKAGSTAGNSFGWLVPVTSVENFAVAAATQHLGEPRTEAYRNAVERRRQHRRRGVVQAMTASLDSRLFLTSDQRTRIAQVLQQEWHDPWLLCVRQLLVRGIEVMPLFPKRQIEGELTAAQEKLLARLPWRPTRPPYVGPSAVTMAGHRNRDVRVVDELEFASEVGGSTP